MDDVEKILEKLSKLEESVGMLKSELRDLKDKQSDQKTYDRTNDSIKTAFNTFNDVFYMVKELKRQMRRSFGHSNRKTVFIDDEGPFDFNFDFNLGNLGDFISNTIHNALGSLEHLTENLDLDFDFEPRVARVKISPGKDISFKPGTVSRDELPKVDDIQHAKEILSVLESKIASLDQLIADTGLNSETLSLELDKLKDKKLVIQEKFGQQRFLLTKLGKKVLNGLKNNSGEQSNN